jgi:hypothetical protein
LNEHLFWIAHVLDMCYYSIVFYINTPTYFKAHDMALSKASMWLIIKKIGKHFLRIKIIYHLFPVASTVDYGVLDFHAL